MSRTRRRSWLAENWRTLSSFWTIGRKSQNHASRDGIGKGPGYEYWSRRPFNGCGPGSHTKRLTNRLERRRAKQAMQRGDDGE